MDICDDLNQLKPTPNEIRNEIRLQREDQGYSGSFVLVEGSSDSRLYKKFFDKKKSIPVIACGKKKILESFSLLDGKFKGFIGIADADFDIILKKNCQFSNLILTDMTDIDSIILCSDALESVLSEYGVDKKIELLEANSGNNIREILYDNALYIGYLRIFNQLKKKSWDFKGILYSNIISQETFRLDRIKLHHELQRINFQNLINNALLMRLSDIFDERIPDPDNIIKLGKTYPWQMCRGHDLVAILHYGFIHNFGDYDRVKHWRDKSSLEEILRTAYNESSFKKTGLYSSILQWETNNTSFNVLKKTESIENS
ncbi:hypothetical protein [Methanoregula sp.]|uniref:hypothetical protein n=1 Tax=Methanoregula sp. TaxID=2052170 RepID=UPI00356129E4